jgi:hypothetical protein
MASHTATGEWQTFELRMRRRRVERLLHRAEAAADEGRHDEARACLEEARRLAPDLPAIDAIRERLVPPTARVPVMSPLRRHVWGAFTAAVTIVVVMSHRPPASLPSKDLRTLRVAPPVVQMAAGQMAELAAPRPAVVRLAPEARARTESTRTESMRAETARRSIPKPRTDSTGDISPVSEVVAVATAGVRLPAPAPTPSPSADTGVRHALDSYTAAYNELDAAAAQRVWPTVNRGALARAFDALASQRVSLGTCRIDITGAIARANCTGSATWTARIGDRSPRTEPRQWTFELARDGDGWRIVNARAQNR